MPAKQPARVTVACPHCGHQQREPPSAYSTVCQKCQRHYRVQEVLRPPPKPPEKPKEIRRLRCFQCGTELEVAVVAQSTMCKRCSSFVDLKDYRIDHLVSKNFKTKGRLVIEEKGSVFNSDSIVGEAILKGKFHGKLVAESSLEIHTTAEIKGAFQTPRIVIPAAQRFRWNHDLVVDTAEIAGELVANLRSRGTVTLRSTARLFGNVEARDFVVESGAVFVGAARIGGSGGCV